jgi:hypothetical protein
VTTMSCWVVATNIICIPEINGTTVRLKTADCLLIRHCALFSHTLCFSQCTTAFLELNRDRYIDATSPADKKAIIHEIVDHIVTKNGRFLKRVKNKNNTKQWIVLSAAKVHLKTAHAIQYRMRKKARQICKTRQAVLATAGMVECNLVDDDSAPFLFLSPKPRQCSTRDCQQTALECSTLCQYCHRLEGYLQWYHAAKQQLLLLPNNTVVPPGLRRLDGDSDQDQNVSNSTGDSTGGEAQMPAADTHCCVVAGSPETSLVAILDKDSLLTLGRNDSLVSLGRSDLSWVPPCFDDSASVATTISDLMDNEMGPDGLWSCLSLDFEGWTDNELGQEPTSL